MKAKKPLQMRSEAEIVTHHMKNLIATYGEEKVRAIVADMFVKRAARRARQSAASNE